MIKYFILGLIQGVTEFLPISSSAHLILAKEILHLPQDITLDVSLHFATLLAVLFFYRKRLWILGKNFFKDLLTKKLSYKKYSYSSKYLFFVLIGVLPAGIAGFFLNDFFESIRDPLIVSFMLILISIYMLFDYLHKNHKKLNKEDLDLKSSLLVGLSQVLALIPGTSRSGVTITTLSLLGLSKEKSAEFSFFLSIPLIFGAFVLSLSKIEDPKFFLQPQILVSFFTAFFVGLLSIKFLLYLLKRYGFLPFIFYRLLLAVVILFVLFFN